MGPGLRRDDVTLIRRRRFVGLRFDLADRVDHRIEGKHGRGVARLVVAHRLEQGDGGGAPFSFSILRTVSRNSRSSPAVEPTTCDAMIEDEACPSAQALTSWAKSVTTGPSMVRSTLTVEPHSFECAVALAPGADRRPRRGILPASSMMRLL
jgi:hypothetical protein